MLNFKLPQNFIKMESSMNALKKYLIIFALTAIPIVADAALSWMQPASIRPQDNYDAVNLSMNEFNQAMVIGVGKINERDIIQASYYSDVWHPVVNCSTYGPYYLVNPIVNLNNKNKALAIWRKVAEKGNSIQAAYASNGVWSTPIDVITVAGQLMDHQLAFNDAGEGIAVWSNTVEHRLEYVTFSHEKWSNPQFLTEQAGEYPLHIQVAMNQKGEKIVAWMKNEEGKLIISSAVSTKDGWTQSGPLGAGQYYSLSLNNNGEAILAWVGEHYNNILVTTYSNNKWSTPQILVPEESLIGVSVSLNNNGNAILSWSNIRSGILPDTTTVKVLRKFKGFWSKPTIISHPDKNAEESKVLLNDLDQAIISYKESEPLDPEPFPLRKPQYSVVRGFCNEIWEKPIIVFSKLARNPSSVSAIALNNHGQAWATGLNRNGFKVARGSFR